MRAFICRALTQATPPDKPRSLLPRRMCSRLSSESASLCVAPFSMHIQEDPQGDILIVTISGQLDTTTAASLESLMLAKIESGDRRILIDGAALRYVNSAGLKVILLAAKRLDAAKGKLMLCALTPNALMIFEMTGFYRIMHIVPTRS